MSIFDAYDQEFSSLSQEVSKNVSELKSYTSSNDKTESLIKMIDALFSQSNELIKQMELEVLETTHRAFLLHDLHNKGA